MNAQSRAVLALFKSCAAREWDRNSAPGLDRNRDQLCGVDFRASRSYIRSGQSKAAPTAMAGCIQGGPGCTGPLTNPLRSTPTPL